MAVLQAATQRWEPVEAPRARARDEVSPGRVVGCYHLVREIGRGGLARIFEARHIHPELDDGVVALKLLHPEWAQDESTLAQFRTEAQLALLLDHPNVVRTHEVGSDDGRMFIVMELVQGMNLADLLRPKRPVGGHLALYIIGELLKGLAHAHELRGSDGDLLGVTHHDVTPANVLLSRAGEIKLTDFGIASLARRRTPVRGLAGKVGYFAPEQIAGRRVDRRADIFTVGVIMFELLSHRPLFTGAAALKENAAARIPRLPDVGLPHGPEQVMRKALAKRPTDRHADARAMLSALRQWLPDPALCTPELAAMVERSCAPVPLVTTRPLLRRGRPHLRALLVSTESRMRTDLIAELRRWRLAVEPASPADVAAVCRRRSFHAAIIDLDGLAPTQARAAAAAFRAAPGMGLQPVIVLEPASGPAATPRWRTTHLPRTTSAATIVAELLRMCDGMQGERAFCRFRIELPALLHFCGRTSRGQTTDVSRNGVGIRCDLIPAVRSEVRVTIDGGRIVAGGVVARVAISDEEPTATIGVQLTQLSTEDEAALVELIGDLAGA